MREPVLLAGALGAPGELLAPLLPRGSDVVRYEHRGHFHTEAPAGSWSLADLADDMRDALDSQDVERASVIGAGFGGMGAIELALRHPERVARLVLICTSAQPGNAPEWRRRATGVRERGLAAIASAVVGRWVTPVTQARQPRTLEVLRAALLTCTDAGYAGCCEAIADWDAMERLGSISAPALVVCGLQDRGIPPAHGRALHARVPGARLAEVPGAGHLPFVDRPAAVAALVHEHLTPSACSA